MNTFAYQQLTNILQILLILVNKKIFYARASSVQLGKYLFKKFERQYSQQILCAIWPEFRDYNKKILKQRNSGLMILERDAYRSRLQLSPSNCAHGRGSFCSRNLKVAMSFFTMRAISTLNFINIGSVVQPSNKQKNSDFRIKIFKVGMYFIV